jgi:hypothetical protein
MGSQVLEGCERCRLSGRAELLIGEQLEALLIRLRMLKLRRMTVPIWQWVYHERHEASHSGKRANNNTTTTVLEVGRTHFKATSS